MRLLYTLVMLVSVANAADTVFVEKPVITHDTVHNTVRVAAPLTAYQDADLALRQSAIADNRFRDYVQFGIWGAGIIGVIIGGILTWLRIRAQEELATAPHNDEMFRTFLERFTDRSQDSSVRIASCIGLQHMSTKHSRIDKKDQPYRTPVINLLVEGIFTEDDPDVCNTIRDQLIEIGGDALQTLVNRHREKFPANDPKQWYSVIPAALALRLSNCDDPACLITPDDLPPNYIASRDAITGIIGKAKPGNLAEPVPKYMCLPRSLRKELWRIWYGERKKGRHIRRIATKNTERWLDGNGLSKLSLVGAILRHAHMERADLWQAHMEHAHLSGVHMEHVDLSEAHLSGVYLYHTHLDYANVAGAILRDAFLIDEADWTACNWWNAKDKPEKATQWLELNFAKKKNKPEFLRFWKWLISSKYIRRAYT
jgi:hypothetical protein